MATQYTRFFDQFQQLIDSVAHDSDPESRLANLQRLYRDGLTIMLNARDEAAYDLRTKYSSQDAAVLTGVDRKFIDYWANRWRVRKMLPPLRKMKRVDLSKAVDLSGR